MTTFASICLWPFVILVGLNQIEISILFLGNVETNLGQPFVSIHLLVVECTLAISIYHCIEARSPQGTKSLSSGQCKYLNYHVDCFCLSFYSENLLRELGTTVEGDLAIVISNTDNLSTDIFDHRILLYWNSLLRILDHRNFIHQNFEGGILYTEISTPEFSPQSQKGNLSIGTLTLEFCLWIFIHRIFDHQVTPFFCQQFIYKELDTTTYVRPSGAIGKSDIHIGGAVAPLLLWFRAPPIANSFSSFLLNFLQVFWCIKFLMLKIPLEMVYKIPC